MIKQICPMGAIQMVPTQSGIVYAVKQEVNGYEDVMRVAYRMFNCDSGETSVVTRNVFLLSKFGNNFTRFESSPRDFLDYKAINLPDRSVMMVDRDGKVEVVNYDGSARWKGDLCFKCVKPHSLFATENGIWVSYRESGVVVRYSCKTFRPEIRIGGAGELPSPEGIWADETRVLVCTAGNNSITEINPETFEINVHQKFNQTPHDYVKIGANEIVLVDSGIYRL